MMRTAAILAAIFIAVTAAVYFGYKYLEKELQQMS
jgi:preprotein translocase subunit SecG